LQHTPAVFECSLQPRVCTLLLLQLFVHQHLDIDYFKLRAS
jgi:hypothetical protein